MEHEAIIRELQVELMRVTEERDNLQHIVTFMTLAAEAEKEKTFAERVEESVKSVVDMVNQGTADPKDVYPPGRYCGD